MTSRRTLLSSPHGTQAFSLLLGSIASSLGAGCGEWSATNQPIPVGESTGGLAPDDGGTSGGAGGSGGSTSEPIVVLGGAPGEVLGCEETMMPSFTEGLELAVEVDSIAFYRGATDHLCTPPRYALVSQSGDACASAADGASCVDEIERLVTESVDWGKYEDYWHASFGLLVVTGSEEAIAQLGGPVGQVSDGSCGSWDRGQGPWQGPLVGHVEPVSELLSRNATTIRDGYALRQLLGTIDNRNEAALVMWAASFDPPCVINEADGTYFAIVDELINDCPYTRQTYELRVTADGSITAEAIGAPVKTDGCAGRRPTGLLHPAGDTCAPDFEAAWLASVARLETAAVVAFAQLSRELERWGAPEELVQRARSAALDEIRHARGTHRLAVARGAQVLPAVTELERERSLLSMAVENAVEGCVRECWGALLAHYQARHALDPHVRELWQTIAQEESGHAVLSMDLAVWLDAQLSSDEHAVVEAAQLQAIEQLQAELGQSQPESAALGLPDCATRLALFAALEEQVFLRRAA